MVFVFVALIYFRWRNNRMCRSPSGLHGGITLATQASPGSQLCIAFNSYNLVRVLRRLSSPCHLHWTRTRPHQVPRPTRSRHSVLLSLILRRASLVMSTHRLCQHRAATADATTQLSISEFLQLCFTKHTFRRTVPLRFFVVHRAPATLATQGKSRLLMPPCSSLLPSSSSGASSPKRSRRDLSQLHSASRCIYSGFPTHLPLS